jgi:hypothetical protein
VSLRSRIRGEPEARPVCGALASNGDRCAREPHDPNEIHSDGQGHTWGARDPFVPVWRRWTVEHAAAKDMSGASR